MKQFDSDFGCQPAEGYGMFWLTDSEHSDINQAMVEAMNEHKHGLYTKLLTSIRERDIAHGKALLAKHGLEVG